MSAVLRSGKLFRYDGGQIETWEKTYREYIGTEYALAVTNGTAALEIALANGWITPDQCTRLGEARAKTEYGQYLIEVAQEAR